MIELPEKPAYRRFANAKNAGLQDLLLRARLESADVLRQFMVYAQAEVARVYPQLNDSLSHMSIQLLKSLDAALDRHAYALAVELGTHWSVLRARSYALAHAAEQQAILNVKGGTPKPIPRENIQAAAYDDTWGVPQARAYLSLSRLRRSVMDKIEVSRILDSTLPEALERVLSAFPIPRAPAKPKVLPRVREAALPPAGDDDETEPFGLSDFLTEDEWKNILYAYQKEFIPVWRDPRVMTDAVSYTDRLASYPAWQLEQDMASDFVAAVRKGEHEGARSQGITDFVWIAVLGAHGKTGEDACEYCQKRDGLTTRQIEAKLAKEWASDPEWSRKATAPLHPHCYCRLAPSTDALPDSPDTGEAEFNDWLAQ